MTEDVKTPSLSDDDILQRAEMINEARRLEQEEKLRQAEAEKAAEEARKAEELRKARELVEADDAAKAKPKKKHTGLKVFLIILGILIVACGVAFISLDISSTSAPQTAMPYQTTYTIYLPQGDTTIAGTTISVVGDAKKLMITLPGAPTKTLAQGDKFTIGTKQLIISIFWNAIKLYECVYTADLTYMGITADNLVTFKAVISTNKQIPEWLMNICFSLSGIKYTKN